MKTNYHTHTQRCLHAGGTEADYVQAALKAGISVLGFSDHAPFPDHDFGLRMPYSDLVPYFSAVEELANAHSSDIMIKKGLEIEYLPRYRDYYESLYTVHHVDYLLLGEHFFHYAPGNTTCNIYNVEKDFGETSPFVDYAKGIAEAMKTGFFQAVAHPDLFTLNHFAWDRNCDAATDIILEAAAQTNTILEFNANGFRRGIHPYPDGNRYMYPHMNFWNRVAGSGIRVIVGSDCHDPKQVWDGCMDQAIDTLKSMGITPIETID